jgi:hypothetical protein
VRVLLAVLAVLLVAPATAGADRAGRPLVKPPLPLTVPQLRVVNIADMPPDAGAYYDETTNEIVSDGPLFHSDRQHEYGHAFDRQLMDDTERAEFTAMIGMQGRPWGSDYDAGGNVVPGVEEFFADEYMTCRMGLLPQGHRVGKRWVGGWISSYGYTPRTNRLQRRIARAMVRWAGIRIPGPPGIWGSRVGWR